MIDKISLENFKAFEKAEIELKPITILIGPNNSGKSSLIQAIMLIQQTLMSGTNKVIHTDNKRFGEFKEILCQKSKTKKIRFKFDFSDKTSIDFTISEKDDIIFVEDFSCSMNEFKYSLHNLTEEDYMQGNRIINHMKTKIEYNKDILESNKIINYELEPVFYRDAFFFKITSIENISSFFDVYTSMIMKSPKLDLNDFGKSISFYMNAVNISSNYYQNVKNIFNNIKYIGPIRKLPDRFYEVGQYKDVGFTGEHGVQILANNDKLKVDVENQFKKMEIAESLCVEKDKNENNFEFKIKTKITEKEVNLADVGCGTSQILPIIVQSIMLHEESMVIVEQPETHLHPKVQADMADFFIKFADNNRRFLLESHSDYFIERLRYGIMNGAISNEDVAIYYVEQNEMEKCSTVNKININSKGQYSNLPENYITNFKLEETRKITKKLLETL